MGKFIIDGYDLKASEEGPDGGPMKVTWAIKHRIQYKEIPYFRDKSLQTSGDGVGGEPGVLWELSFQVRSITKIRFQFFKTVVAEKAGPHTIITEFGRPTLYYLQEASFEQDVGEREPGPHGIDIHYTATAMEYWTEFVGTWNFKFLEASD